MTWRGLLLTEVNFRFASHWQWVLMLIILIVGLSALALLAVFLKRRHARKVDERRAALSGFPAARSGSSPEIGHGRDMWGPHQHMAHTRGWEYTSEQDREMREASAAAGGGVLGSAIGKSKSRRLGKKSRHSSQRSTRHNEAATDRVREEEDENTRTATAAVRRSKTERRRDREEERQREKEVERGLRGLPIKDHDGRAGKEKQRADMDESPMREISDKEKDIG